jgi:hypothetical protein
LMTFLTSSNPGTNLLWSTMISGHGLCSAAIPLLVFIVLAPPLPKAGMADQLDSQGADVVTGIIFVRTIARTKFLVPLRVRFPPSCHWS